MAYKKNSLFVLNRTPIDTGGVYTNFFATDNTLRGAAPTCPSCGSFIGMRQLIAPISVELESLGNGWGDIAFGSGDEILVTDRLLKLAREHGLSGFEQIDSVTIESVDGKIESIDSPPIYWILRVPRSEVAIDEVASGIVITHEWKCSDCRSGYIKRLAKIILEPGITPQHDIFYLRGLPGVIIVSDQFRRVCERNKLNNCRLIPASEYSLEFYPEELN